MMKSAMTIHVEFMAGTEISAAIEEAKQKAGLFDLAYVEFDFNGVKMSIGRNCNVKDAAEDFSKKLASKSKFKSVIHS